MTSTARVLPQPRVLICNERFLARFGVDRILVLLAEYLVAQGVAVSFACLRADRAVLERLSDSIDVLSMPEGVDLAGADALATQHLLAAWRDAPVDVVVAGGWPFYGIAARARAAGIHSVYIDAGAVPHDGFSEAALPAQRELRRLRQATLPYIETILPISRFICETQTEPDRGFADGVTTVLLGADHLAERPFAAGPETPAAAESDILSGLDERIAGGSKLILALGRVETEGYKNSLAALDVLRALRRDGCDAHLLLMTGPDTLKLPDDLRGAVTTLPTITDAALQAIMARCSLGLSLSLWEGFNLPIAEMQWLGRPVLAFALGAHPEVIADPWFLCGSQAEMIGKAAAILVDGLPVPLAERNPFERFRERFTWASTLSEWTGAILEPVLRPKADPAVTARRLVVVDVSNSARDPANSGVARVTRRLTAILARQPEFDLVFVQWNRETGGFERLRPENQPFLSSNAGPTDWVGQMADALANREPLDLWFRAADPHCTDAPLLFLPEVILDGSAEARVQWGRARGFRCAFVFYDMLPVYQKHLVDVAVAEAFPNYLAGLRASDALYAISGFSLSECERWHADHGETLPERREVIWLPSQFSDHPRVTSPPEPSERVHILCVSTIEPRKNHRLLIEAFQMLRRRRPDLPIQLDLVGNSYAGAEALAAWVRQAAREDDHLVWHGVMPDVALAELYRRAQFTVYPSLAEGFGLPIMESLWMGRPCVCHEGGVMAELAAEGGCLTVDVGDAAELSAAMEQMVVNTELREILGRQVFARAIGVWDTYGAAIARRLRDL